jgi:dTDP-4-amino-4,6-dideoxygalactose transaminase
VKILTTEEGGFATTNTPRLMQYMDDLRSHGITKEEDSF